MLNTITKVLLLIIGATRTFSKSFRKYLRNVPRKNVKELQRTTIGTEHVGLITVMTNNYYFLGF
jgi:hypothetical protein